MENMTKALIIAAAMIGVVLILSILMLGYNRISAHYKNEHDLAMIEQTEEFNKRFENYNREGVRGNDIISLMNRIIDYNASQSYQDETKYPRIEVTIEIGKEHLGEFIFGGGDSTYLLPTITNKGKTGTLPSDLDKDLIKVTGIPSNLINKYSTKFEGLTETILQKLSAEITSIIPTDESGETKSSTKTLLKRAQILESVLGLIVVDESYTKDTEYDIKINLDTGLTVDDTEDYIPDAKDMATQYYQYTQFKRAKFNCTEMNYDKATGRVVEIKFEVQTKNNSVVFE